MEAAKELFKINAVPHHDAELDAPSSPTAAHMLLTVPTGAT